MAREGKKITNGSEPFQPCNDAVIEGGSETDVLPNRFLTAISHVMSGEKSGLQSSQRNLMEGDMVVERKITSEIAVYTFEILHLKH